MPRIIEFNGVRHNFPDDFTDQDVQDALVEYGRKRVAGIKQRLPELRRQAEEATTGWGRQTVPQQIVQGTVKSLPTIGGIAGGALGALTGAGAGAVAGAPGVVTAPGAATIGGIVGGARGAAIGGGAGRALEEYLGPHVGLPGERAATPGAMVGDIAASSAGQAALAGGPEILGRAGMAAAQPLMRTALAGRVAEGSRAAASALAERIGPGFTGRFPKQVAERINKLAQKQTEILDRETALGKWHNPADLRKAGDEYLRSKEGRALTPAERDKFNNWFDGILGDYIDVNPMTGQKVVRSPVDPVTLNIWKQRYSNAAKKFYGGDAGEAEYVAPGELLPKRWAKVIGDKSREMLHTKHPEMVPVDRVISNLKGLERPAKGLQKESARRLLPYAPRAGAAAAGFAVTPGDWHQRALGALTLGALASPQTFSNLALMAQRSPALIPWLRTVAQGTALLSDMDRQSAQP